jgi:hypothetical protein
MVLPWSPLLDPRICRRRIRSQHQRHCQSRRCSLHDQLYLQLPRYAPSGPQSSKGCCSSWRGLQPLHSCNHPSRYWHQALDSWFQEELDVECSAHHLRLAWSCLLRHGYLGCDRGADLYLRPRWHCCDCLGMRGTCVNHWSNTITWTLGPRFNICRLDMSESIVFIPKSGISWCEPSKVSRSHYFTPF